MKKRILALVMAAVTVLGTFGAITVFAKEPVAISTTAITQIEFNKIYTAADKGTKYDGNLFLCSDYDGIDPYFDGVRVNDWFEFDVQVEKAGDYHFCFSFGWTAPSGVYNVSVDGGEPVTLKNTVTGLAWRDWIDSTEESITLSEGKHTVKVVMGSDGPNLHAFKIAPVGVPLVKGGTQYSASLSDSNAASGAQQAKASAAIQFNSTMPFAGMAIVAASWSNNIGSLRFSLYKWNSSYHKTLRSQPVATEDFIDFKDNATLRFLFDEVPAGEYLFYIENISTNVSEPVGYWGYNSAVENVRSYFDNQETDFCPRVSVLHGTADVANAFAPISDIDPNAVELEASDRDLYTFGDAVGYDMNENSKYGVQFKSEAAFGGVELFVHAVPTGDNSITLELYKWNKNYSQTVKSVPVAKETLKNVNLGSWISLEAELEAGEYLFVAKDGTDGMKVAVVETPTENVNHYLYTSKAGVSLACRIIGEKKLATPTAPEAQEFITNDASTWVGTDGLDRVLPTVDTTGGIREDKFVGIFYHTWHSAFAYRSVVNVTELLEKYPEAKNDYDHAAWNGETNCFWNEPIWGYYNNGVDRWVLRKQAEMLADAGVDVVFFDNTNGAMNFVDAIMTLCEVWAEARNDGVKTPQISAMLNMYDYGDTATQIKELYDEIYSKGLYQDLWFYWEGKPLLLGYPERLKGLEGGKEAYNFFSYRPINTGYTENADLILEHTDANGNKVNRVGYSYPSNTRGYTFWKWISIYPQEKMYYQRRPGSFVEEMCVCVAQNWTARQGLTAMNDGDEVFGRGYTHEFGPNTSIEAAQQGLNFAEQWNYALEVDPKFIYITGWNEWQVGRTVDSWGTPNALPDNATDGYSRDVEPSTGALKDHFYNQMVSFIRKFKGSNTQTPSSGVVSNYESINWDAVTPVYRTYAGNTLHRDYDGYKGYHYTNTTGRNDFVESRVTYDKENVYFMVKTAEDITPYTDPAWMRLLIDVVGVEETDANNWETFEYIVNRTNPTDSKAVLEKSTGGWNWEKVADIDYTVNGDTMTVTIPRSALGISADAETFSLNFKWSDNMQKDGDIMDFYVSGDVAPGARFKYSFTSVGDEVIVVGGDETTTAEETTVSAETEALVTDLPVTEADDASDVTDAPAVEETTAAEAEGCKSSMIGGGAVVASAVALAGYALAKKKKED